MRLRRAKSTTPDHGTGQSTPPSKKRPLQARLRKAEREIEALSRRMADLENELQNARHLNKRLAEIADVVAEVLLPAMERDEERIRATLSRYDATL